jgi:hypothetical protein
VSNIIYIYSNLNTLDYKKTLLRNNIERLFKKILNNFLKNYILENVNIKLNTYNEELQCIYNYNFIHFSVIYSSFLNKSKNYKYLNKSLTNVIKIYTNELQLMNKLKQKLDKNLKKNNDENN